MATCLMLLAFFSGVSPGAETTSWTGSTNSLWSEGTNWDNGVPTIGYIARIEDAANNPVSLVGPVVIDALTIGATNSLTLEGLLGTCGIENAGTITLDTGVLATQILVACRGGHPLWPRLLPGPGDSPVVGQVFLRSVEIRRSNPAFSLTHGGWIADNSLIGLILHWLPAGRFAGTIQDYGVS